LKIQEFIGGTPKSQLDVESHPKRNITANGFLQMIHRHQFTSKNSPQFQLTAGEVHHKQVSAKVKLSSYSPVHRNKFNNKSVPHQ